MKKFRGFVAAGIIGAIAYVLGQYGQRFSTLIDMIYPYVIRNLQGILAQWSGQVDFCLWQVLAVMLGVVALAALVVVLALKGSVIEWSGWVMTGVALIYLLHMLLFGMNYYAGDLSEDIRLEVPGITLQELTEATTYYRNAANALAKAADRDANGDVDFASFETLANKAGEGFDFLTYERYFPVFAGSKAPVKKLGWADMYSSMGITGFTCGITGEAAVNPQIPDTTLPFTMCHEMAHRMCIVSERDANFTGFLACAYHPDVDFQYSGFFMAFRYCYYALASVNTPEAAAAAGQITQGINDYLKRDMMQYDNFFRSRKNDTATAVADRTNDTYLKASGQKEGIASYGQVCNLLVNWYVQEVVMPTMTVEESIFDPYDETQVDLSGIVNARG